MTPKKVAIIGDGKIAADCLRAAECRPELRVVADIYHRNNPWSGRNAAASNGAIVVPCDNVNEPAVVRCLSQQAPDLIVNVNSFDILKAGILNLAADGIINFHNGPLPEYRGVNIPTWAIFNGEAEHGVSWHLVEPTVDTGDILAEERFPLSADETAIALIFKCLDAGLRQFERVLELYIANGGLHGVPQRDGGSYYRARDLPNGGFIDFNWSVEQLSRFVRAFTFRPFPDAGLRARFRAGPRIVYAGSMSLEPVTKPALPPGTLVEVLGNSLRVATPGAQLRISELASGEGTPVDPASLPVTPGEVISSVA